MQPPTAPGVNERVLLILLVSVDGEWPARAGASTPCLTQDLNRSRLWPTAREPRGERRALLLEVSRVTSVPREGGDLCGR